MSTAAVVVAEATKTEVDAAPISEVRPRPRARRSTRAPALSTSSAPPPTADRRPVRHLPPPSQDAKARRPRAGITHLTPVQERTLRAVIVSGRDVLVQAPTGSGKTLAYLLPLAHALAAEEHPGPATRRRTRPVSPPPSSSSPPASSLRKCSPTPKRTSPPPVSHACCASVAFPRRPRWPPSHPAGVASSRHAGSRQRVFRPRRDSNRRAHRPGPRRSRPIARRRLRTGRGGGDATPGGRCRVMCLSATMPPRLARFLQRRLPPNHAEVSLHGRGGGNVGGAVEHLALTCHPDDAIGTILAAVDAYAPKGRRGCGGWRRKRTRRGRHSPVAAARGQAIVFVETKAAAERLAGTLAIAYEVRSSPLRTSVRFPSSSSRPRRSLFFSRPVRGRLRRLRRRRSMIPHTHRPDHNMWANEIDYNSMRPRRFCFGARTSRSARFSSRSVPRDAHHYLHSLRMTMITTTHRHFYVTERPGARRADSNRPARPVVLPGPDPRRAVTITFFTC